MIWSLVRKAILFRLEEFVVWGDGSQRRCFVYIDDAIDGIFALRSHVERKGSLTVNIGSTEEVTVQDLAKKVIALSGKEIQVRHDTTKPTGALNRKPDLGRARDVLGWAPKTPFDVGLPRTYEWAEGRLRG